MRRYILIIAFLSTINSFGQEDNLTVEQQRLSFIKGKWTVDGSELTYIEICDWIQGNHLQCASNLKTVKLITQLVTSPTQH